MTRKLLFTLDSGIYAILLYTYRIDPTHKLISIPEILKADLTTGSIILFEFSDDELLPDNKSKYFLLLWGTPFMMRAYKIGCEIDLFDDMILCEKYSETECDGFVSTKASMSILNRIKSRYAGSNEELLLNK